MSDKFYIMDTTATGELILWWRPNRRGYTTLLDEAGVYSAEEAEKIVSIGRGTDIPCRQSHVDGVARTVVFVGTLPTPVMK